MKPAENTHLFFLDNEGLLFHEKAQKLFHLNTVATYIWCLLEEEETLHEMIANLQETFDVSEKNAREYLAQAKSLYESLGVLAGFENEYLVSSNEPNTSSDAEIEKIHSHEFYAESHYRLLSTDFSLRFSDKEIKEIIDPILQHFRSSRHNPKSEIIDIIRNGADQFLLFRNQEQIGSCDSINKLGPITKGLVGQTAVENHSFFLAIHAGVVGNGQQCILLPAAPGSGKSTLTAALVNNGFQYFSDEVALLRESDLAVEPFPLSTCVKDTGVKVLSRFYPDLPELTLHLRADGKRVRYVPPPEETVPETATFQPIAAVVFPKYVPDCATELEEIKPLEAVKQLMEECLMVDTHLDDAKVSRLLDWIKNTPSYKLTVSDLNEAVRLMQNLSDHLKLRLI